METVLIDLPLTLPLWILLLLISFASVNAVLFTPALPEIATFFGIPDTDAQLTVTFFLAGYALGQLLYGPLANRFGRKKTLYIGITIQIISSLFCAFSGILFNYIILLIARFTLAIGSGVGLKITVTMINEVYPPRKASQRMSQLMLAFAITPGIAVAIGGILNTYFGWMSCFYACTLYGFVMLFLVSKLPETQPLLKLNALKLHYLLDAYRKEFTNTKVILGGLLVGMCSAFIYVFAALSPFIAINLFQMSSENFGFANLIPMFGIFLGSLISTRLAKFFLMIKIVKLGITLAVTGTLFMSILLYFGTSAFLSIFFSTLIVNIGQVMILANASTIAMMYTNDKSHGAAVINFIAVGIAMLCVLGMSQLSIQKWSLSMVFTIICLCTIFLFSRFSQK